MSERIICTVICTALKMFVRKNHIVLSETTKLDLFKSHQNMNKNAIIRLSNVLLKSFSDLYKLTFRWFYIN